MNQSLTEWLAGKKIMSAAEVKRLEPGAEVWVHQCYGRLGEHLYTRAKVVQYGKTKKLETRDHNWMPVYRDIKDGDRIAYTED